MGRRFKGIFHPDINRLPNKKEELRIMIFATPIYFDDILKKIGVTNFTAEAFFNALTEYLALFIPFLRRKEHLKHFTLNIHGRLSSLARKTIQGIALNFSVPSDVRNMSNFMTNSLFDHEGMLKEYQNVVLSDLSHPEAMLTGDGCDNPKKGNHSVAVARQYCGNEGKKDNCQAGVVVGIVSPEGHALLGYQLYVPKKWLGDDYEIRRKECRVPQDLVFKTKNQLLLEEINNICASGRFTGKYVGVDSAFGRDHIFLDSLPDNLVYFADVPCTLKVFPTRPDMVVPEYSGRGRKPIEHPTIPSQQVKDVIDDPSVPWVDVVLGIGAKGPIITKDKCVKVVEVRDGKPGKDVWLYARQLEDKSVKYALCNESMDASVEMIRKLSLMRWSIEQCFKECKEYLGMDHYETRSWTAWRRNMLFTLISHFFITKLRRRFTTEENYPGPVPHVLAPVDVEDYREAVIQFQNGQDITHPNVSVCPKGLQQIMTIGLIKDLIDQYLPKVGIVLTNIDHLLRSSAQAFESHSLSKLKLVFATETQSP